MNLSTKPQPQPKSWAISVRCRSKGLDFRMSAANILPNWGNGGERFSIFLRLKRFLLLKVESKFRDPTRNLELKKKGRLRRFWGSFRKLFGGRWRKGENRKVNVVKGKDCGNVNSMRDESWCKYQTSLVPAMGSLSLLSYSSTQRDHKGILIHAFSYVFYLASFIKITEDAKVSSIFILILVCIAVLLSYLNYGAIISKAVYLGWNWICLLAFIYPVFSKLIYSSPPVSIERIRMTWCLLIFTSILALLYTLRREILLYAIKIAFYGSQAWFSGLLLTMQALFQTFYESRGKKYAFGALLSSAYFWGKELANYLVPSLQVYIPKAVFNVPKTIFSL